MSRLRLIFGTIATNFLIIFPGVFSVFYVNKFEFAEEVYAALRDGHLFFIFTGYGLLSALAYFIVYAIDEGRKKGRKEPVENPQQRGK